MYTCPLVCHMAKLYWRVKKNKKWTWTAANVLREGDSSLFVAKLEDENQTTLEDFGADLS